MADKVGLEYETYRRIEVGKVLVTTENLLRIASILGLTTDYILSGSEVGINDKELAQLINNLSDNERIKAKKVLEAVFFT